LDAVEEEQSVLVGDKLEVDGVDDWPDLPGSLAGSKKIVLELVSNGGEGVTIAQSKVGEEDSHEDRAPADLINGNLQSDRLSVLSWDFGVEPVVEVVTRRTVVKETKGRKSDESLPVEWTSSDENLPK
jgi:hypothetical protein